MEARLCSTSIIPFPHVTSAPPELGDRYFHCRVCGRCFSKRSAWRHFTGATTHGLDKDIVKHWVVVKDSHHLGNKTPTRMQLGVLLDANHPRSSRPNDDDVHVVDEVVVMDDVPDIIPDTACTTDPTTVQYSAQEVPDSDEELRAFAKRCPIPKSWTTASTSTREEEEPKRRRKRGKQPMYQ